MPAGKRADIPFEFKVPANATPGDHIGGLVASVRQTEESADGQRPEVERRVAARVYLRVTGPVQALTSTPPWTCRTTRRSSRAGAP